MMNSNNISNPNEDLEETGPGASTAQRARDTKCFRLLHLAQSSKP